MYWITIERPNMKSWRGNKVPFIVQVRLHYKTDYKAGSRIWFNLWGPDFFEWAKSVR